VSDAGALSAQVDDARARGLEAVRAATTLEELDAARSAAIGRKGFLAAIQRQLGGLDPDGRRTVGARVNAVRAELEGAEAERRAALEGERDRVQLAAEAVDVTLPPRTPKRGMLHPVHETMEAMVDVLVGLGYRAVTGPEVESDWFNFEALNMPPEHPARSMWDTLYLEDLHGGSGGPSTVLRTHTSPVQARVMLAQPPPVYVAVPGRTFRSETPDATHLPVFHQIEGLAVDEGLSFADLRGTLLEFCRALLGADTDIRLRPSYFPFTEPSCEVDAFYGGRWVELLGAGMVNPNVFRAVGYDVEAVQGFAFGIGVERVAMLRHGVNDLRLFVENDLRFLAQF
jgi:phenylalanyl-tRNA synthetase alpha chain